MTEMSIYGPRNESTIRRMACLQGMSSGGVVPSSSRGIRELPAHCGEVIAGGI